MLKKHLKVISVLLCIFLILGTGYILFVKAGRKIANTPAVRIEYYDGGENIVINDSQNKNFHYSYNTVSNTLNEFTETENKKYFKINGCNFTKQASDDIIAIFVENEEKISKTLFKINPEDYRKNDKWYCSVSELFEYKNDVYFTFKEYENFYLYKYNCTNEELTKYKISGSFIGFFENFAILKDGEKFNKIDLNTGLEELMFILSNEKLEVYRYFKATDKGIIAYSEVDSVAGIYFELYDYSGKLKKVSKIIENTYVYNSGIIECLMITQQGEIYFPVFFENFEKIGLVYLNEDFSYYTVISENIAPKKSKNIEDDISETPWINWFIKKDSKIYYIALTQEGRWANDDAFAFCSIDNNGNIEVIKARKKHFLRNFFKSSFR